MKIPPYHFQDGMTADTHAEAIIRDRIAQRGSITFAELMDVALYGPVAGYYSSDLAIGPRGDFYTSPSAHPAFAALLAVQLHRMWELLERPYPFYAVEIGAAGSELAQETTAWSRNLATRFADALTYLALDRRRDDSSCASGGDVHSVTAGAFDIPLTGVTGCFLSNELVDSFPAHRFQVRDGAIEELYVSVGDGDALVEVPGEPSDGLVERLNALDIRLPDGLQGEVRLNTGRWLSQVSESLSRGFVLTIDYGYEAGALYSPARPLGTVQTYYAHTRGADPFVRIGEQDITAHVDFSQLIDDGVSVGLQPVALVSQAGWLKGLGFDGMLRRLRESGLSQTNLRANTMSMLDLVRPEGLGGFRVLLQQKGTGVESIGPLTPAGWQHLPQDLPLLGPRHMRLLEGRYPHEAWDPGDLWPYQGPG